MKNRSLNKKVKATLEGIVSNIFIPKQELIDQMPSDLQPGGERYQRMEEANQKITEQTYSMVVEASGLTDTLYRTIPGITTSQLKTITTCIEDVMIGAYQLTVWESHTKFLGELVEMIVAKELLRFGDTDPTIRDILEKPATKSAFMKGALYANDLRPPLRGWI